MKALIPWRRTTDGMGTLRHEIDDLFDRFFGPIGETVFRTNVWAPRVDVAEAEKEIFVKVDLPGVDPKLVDITIVNGFLVIKGEKKDEKEVTGKNYHKVERFFGTFYREIPLPPGADSEKITATSVNGVVTIVVPKVLEALPKKVAVKALV
jgi:HSP20 family protein